MSATFRIMDPPVKPEDDEIYVYGHFIIAPL